MPTIPTSHTHPKRITVGKGKRRVRPTIITSGEVSDLIANEIKKALAAAHVPSETTQDLPERLAESVKVKPYSDRKAEIQFEFYSNSRGGENPYEMSKWFLEGTESHLIQPVRAPILSWVPDERWPPYRRVNKNTIIRLPPGSRVYSKGHWVTGLSKPDGDPVEEGIEEGMRRVKQRISQKTSNRKSYRKKRIKSLQDQRQTAQAGGYTSKSEAQLIKEIEKNQKEYNRLARAQRARAKGEFPLERGTMVHADVIGPPSDLVTLSKGDKDG